MDEKPLQINKTRELSSRKKINLPHVPMDDYKEKVLETVRANDQCVVIGETGSGKTTRIPSFLMDEFPDARIAITQPRRIAARSVSEYVAESRGTRVGDEIGYHVRNDNCTSRDSRAVFMTDGILLRKLQSDPRLQEYDIVMVDEAHERNLNSDFILGLLKRVQVERKKNGEEPLKIIVASATIEKEKFSNYFDSAPVVEVPGRMFPVEVIYEHTEVDNYMRAAASKVSMIVDSGEEGDILIFMPGAAEIHTTIKEIDALHLAGIECIPLYGDMKPEDQQRIFASSKKRKVIVATNIAETSLTIQGVCFVVDSGFIRQNEYDPISGIESLLTREHAQSGCEQRKGRAGRTAPGTCYRLYTPNDYERRKPFQTPELLRLNLDHVILQMKKMGIDDVHGFDFIDTPEVDAIDKGIASLKLIGALDEHEKLTEIGEIMADLPLRPDVSRMLIEAQKYGCVESVATIAAMLGVKSVFITPEDKRTEAGAAHAQFKQDGSDFIAMLKVWEAWVASSRSPQWARDTFLNAKQLREIGEIRMQLFDCLREHDIAAIDTSSDVEAIKKSVAAGLVQHLMVRQGRYQYIKVAGNNGYHAVYIFPGSALRNVAPEYIIGYEVVTTSKPYARKCQRVEPKILPDIAPGMVMTHSNGLYYDAHSDAILDRVTYTLQGHFTSIDERVIPSRDTRKANECFVRAIVAGDVDMPSVHHNDALRRDIQLYYVRTGGMVQMPDLSVWYKATTQGARTKAEAYAYDDAMKLDAESILSPKQREEIDKNYPTALQVKGHTLSVTYHFKPGNPSSWRADEQMSEYKATIDVPFSAVFEITDADIPSIGVGSWRPEIMYSLTSDEGYRTVGATLEKLQNDVIERHKIALWNKFKKSRVDVWDVYDDVEFLPTIEACGLNPISYGVSHRGEEFFGFPGFDVERFYDSSRETYTHRYGIRYFDSPDEARRVDVNARSVKQDALDRAHRKKEQGPLLADAQERFNDMKEQVESLLKDYVMHGLTYTQYEHLDDTWTCVKGSLDEENLDVLKATRYMNEIDELLLAHAKENSLRAERIETVKARADVLQKTMYEITYDNFEQYGLEMCDYYSLQGLWGDIQILLSGITRYGSVVAKDPDSADEKINEIKQILAKRQKGKKLQFGDKIQTGVFAELLQDKKIVEKTDEVSLPPRKVIPVAETSVSHEKEKMTDELRTIMQSELNTARFFLDLGRTLVIMGAKGALADKIAKLRAKSTGYKNELKEVVRELADTDTAPRMRGKVTEIIRKSDKVAEDVGRLENVRDDWTYRFKHYMDRIVEIANIQEIIIDDTMYTKMRPLVAAKARAREEYGDIDEVLLSILVEVA